MLFIFVCCNLTESNVNCSLSQRFRPVTPKKITFFIILLHSTPEKMVIIQDDYAVSPHTTTSISPLVNISFFHSRYAGRPLSAMSRRRSVGRPFATTARGSPTRWRGVAKRQGQSVCMRMASTICSTRDMLGS